MSSHSDLPNDGVSRSRVAGSEAAEDGWIPVDLDAIAPQGSAEPAPSNAPTPKPIVLGAQFGPPALSENLGAGKGDAPKLELHHDAQDLEPPVAVSRLHGWLERLRPSEPGLLSFERSREIAPEPPTDRRVPERDIIFIGRRKEPPRAGPAGGFNRAPAAETPGQPLSCEASNDDHPGPASRRRKLLLGLALLIAMTGALQALMRSTQAPTTPAVVDVLTF